MSNVYSEQAANGTQGRPFRAAEHLIQLKGKDYLPVQWRLVWFRQECPAGEIVTELVHLDLEKEVIEEVAVWNPTTRKNEKVQKQAKGIAVFRARVTDGRGGVATGTKSENAASFADFIEKSETGAIGRALAGLGYGTQFAPELNEEHRIMDSPVEKAYASGAGETGPQEQTSERPASTLQTDAIKRLCRALDKPMPVSEMTSKAAGQLITQLNEELKIKKTASGQTAVRT